MWIKLNESKCTVKQWNVSQHVSGVFTPILRRSATYSTQCTQLASRLSNITTVTTGQIKICSENAVWPPEDGRKDARNMLRNNWLTIKSLNVASRWSHIYLIIKDARSLEHKVGPIMFIQTKVGQLLAHCGLSHYKEPWCVLYVMCVRCLLSCHWVNRAQC